MIVVRQKHRGIVLAERRSEAGVSLLTLINLIETGPGSSPLPLQQGLKGPMQEEVCGTRLAPRQGLVGAGWRGGGRKAVISEWAAPIRASSCLDA